MLEQIANESRKNIVRMIYEAQSGHPGGSLSCIDILIYLYHREMNFTRDNVNCFDRNRCVLSKGHAAPALYATLSSIGILDYDELLSLRKIDSSLQGHPNMNDTMGVDMSTGSLGQGISAAVGMALGYKIKKLNNYVYVICGDGEFEEGQVYEALIAAAHYHLDNLILYLDYNGLQIDGHIETVMDPSPFQAKFLAFGWDVIQINGHNFEEIESATMQAKSNHKPTAIIAHTIKGKGVSFMEDQVSWHGKAPNKEEYLKAIKELNEEGEHLLCQQ